MATTLQLKKMTKSEKLRVMEELWTDLTRDEAKFSSPTWHLKALEQTELEIQSGRVKFMDWDDAKKSLLRRAR